MTLDEIVESLRACGLSQLEQPVPQLTDEPNIPEFVCLPNGEAAQRYYTDGTFGHGAHPDPSVARLIAVAEMIERLSLANADPGKIETGRYTGGPERVDPGSVLSVSGGGSLPGRPTTSAACGETTYQWWPARDRGDGTSRQPSGAAGFSAAWLGRGFPDPPRAQLHRRGRGAVRYGSGVSHRAV